MSTHPSNSDERHDVPGQDAFSIKELVDASPAVISLIDAQRWQIRFQNASGGAMFGDIVGKRCHENIAQSPTRCSFCKASEALETGRVTSSEVSLPDGRCMLIQWA
ncbi:MAG: hypothetical protein ACREJU_14475, partial [Nitrospiraceae bacterium]